MEYQEEGDVKRSVPLWLCRDGCEGWKWLDVESGCGRGRCTDRG